MTLTPPLRICTDKDYTEVMEVNEKARIVYMIVHVLATPDTGNSPEIAERVQFQIHNAYQYLFKEGFIEMKDPQEKWFTHAAAILFNPK